MSSTLSEYKKKRSFSHTPEPQGGKGDAGHLRFVIQKHAASTLHYDFRLEMDGVLKSWAIPKGPSTDPSVKRLAIKVEDHPLDYQDFEGLIPKGQYGGGTVLIWDRGNYILADDSAGNKKSMDAKFLQQLRKGSIHFVLNGSKLRGEFALVRASHLGKQAWLLIKTKDKYAQPSDITKKDKSVVSGRSLKQIEKTSAVILGEKKGKLHKEKNRKKSTPGIRKTLLSPHEETQEIVIGKQPMTFTHLSKIYWPAEKITKRDLLNYYYEAAPVMLPYLKDRPQSLNRHPNGIGGKAFFQKDVSGKVPEWINTFPYHSEGDDRDKEFLVCTNEASLLYMVSLGCIEINPWSSRVQTPDQPDWCIIDLDPDNNTFDQVMETALITHQLLEEWGASNFCKTSGSTGLHIYIPLGAKYTYDQSKEFARLIVARVNKELPKTTSIERPVKNRKGKIYLDFLQNRPQATLAAPYSVRPKPGATVSMPLHWEELTRGLSMKDFTMNNAMARIAEKGDIFKKVLGRGISLQKIISEISKHNK
jgi:bifunctional non-homologous end joining protein LigD